MRNELKLKYSTSGTDGCASCERMASGMDSKVAAFLRKERGETTFSQFSRKTGLPASTLFRIENGQQSVTLARLEPVLKRLKKTPHDVFCD